MGAEKEEQSKRAVALSAMQSLFSGLEGRIMRQRMLPHPGDGSLYDFDPNRVSRRSQVEGDLSPGGDGWFRRRTAVGLLHKPMLGTSNVKVCVVLDFAFSDRPIFTPEALTEAASWALAPQRPDIYYLIGIAGCADEDGLGHNDELKRSLSGGINWRGALIEHLNPGWVVTAPEDGAVLPGLMTGLFDPEPIEQKVARIDAALASADELKHPGGFLVLEDIASRVMAGNELVTDRAVAFAERTPGLDVKDVNGSLIIQRDRFESLRT